MKKALEKELSWRLTRMGRIKPHGDSRLIGSKATGSQLRVTTGWEYQGPET